MYAYLSESNEEVHPKIGTAWNRNITLYFFDTKQI